MILIAVATISYLAGVFSVCLVLAALERDSRGGYIAVTSWPDPAPPAPKKPWQPEYMEKPTKR
jgi:hypothetical protein